MKSSSRKAMSVFMTALLLVGSLWFPSQAADTRIQISESEMQELLNETGGGGTVTVRDRVAVHDPSIVMDGKGGYYIFGSHMAVAKTEDLSNWEGIYSESVDSKLFGDVDGKVTSYQNAFVQNAFTGEVPVATPEGIVMKEMGSYDIAKWLQHADYSNHKVQGNMWAPDVIYNEVLGKWCMYLSMNGPRWNSSIILLTADEIEGPYVYQAPVIFTGFTETTVPANVLKSFKDTDLELVLGEMDELPAKYNQINPGNSANWGSYWPHAIDANVFYDEEGTLWMVYGSWSAGICMIELDASTGLRDYTVTYESNYDTLKQKWTSDAYFGKRVAGGYYVSGEGPYIEKIDDYYYMFITYGALEANGGYVMRVFRSENPDGPYVGPSGESPIFDKYAFNYSNRDGDGERGAKIMGYYKWDSMKRGEGAQGHNSVLTDEDGKHYVIYHTRFTDGTGFHEVRVHQLFVNADGWLVAAPYEYDGEALSETPYTTAQAAGEYDVIVHEYHQDYANLVPAIPKQVTLLEDGSVTGAYTGTWSLSDKKPEISLVLGGKTYKGVLVEQKVDGENYEALCFTAANEDGLNIWGTAIQNAKKVIASNVKDFNFAVPDRTYESFTLPAVGTGGAEISWSSDTPSLLSAAGELVGSPTEDTVVTLTAQISKGAYYYNLPFQVTVKAGSNQYSERTLIASCFINDPQNLSDKDDGSLYIPNPFNDGVSKGFDLSGGVSIEFDVEKTGPVNVLGTILGFEGGGKLYFTPGSYLGYNANGKFYDANLNDYKLVEDYIGDSAHVALYFYPDGFEVKVNGQTAYTQEILETENGGGTLDNYKNVINWLKNTSDTLYFGYGAWWLDFAANCTISNVEFYVEPAIEERDEVIIYEKEEHILSSNSSISREANPFYQKNVDAFYMEYTINFAEDAIMNGWDGIFSFFDTSTAGRLSMQVNPYLCFNTAGAEQGWIDFNQPNGKDWISTAQKGVDYRVTVMITEEETIITVDGKKQELRYNSSGANVNNRDILDFLSSSNELTWGVGLEATSYWNTEKCILKDILIINQPGAKKLGRENVTLDSPGAIERLDNPFYEKDLSYLQIEYTLNFAEGAAKNGWDGIFSFFNSATGGRVSMQTNPYICFNSMVEGGPWIDLNHPHNGASTNWAISSETVKGQDYQIKVVMDENDIVITVDGEVINFSQAGSSPSIFLDEILSYIPTCDQFTFGVGQKATSFWDTELATIKNFNMIGVVPAEYETEELPEIITLEDGSKQILKASAIEYQQNPLYGKDLEEVKVSYSIQFAENAVKTGWDGLFSFYNPDTNGRVSFQSGPFLCYNNWEGSWVDINRPNLAGATKWAATAQAGQTYRVDVVITEEGVTMEVDGIGIALDQEASESFASYGEILDCIAGSEFFTIGVGLAETSFWHTELCTMSNIEVTGIEKESGGDVSGGDNGGGDVSGGDNGGGDVSGGDNGSDDSTQKQPPTSNTNNDVIDSNHYGTSHEASKYWDMVNKGVSAAIATTTERFNYTVATGRNIVVPTRTLEALRNSNATLAMHSGVGVTFSITGDNMPSHMDTGKTMNLSVRKGELAAPAALVQEKIQGTIASRQIPMESHESFGMVVNLHFALGAENVNHYANLYRYNEVTGLLEYVGSYQINKDGQAMFGTEKGADFLLTVTSKKPNETAVTTGREYVVRSGDTLSRIASKNGISLARLVALNPEIMDISKIRPGQKIIIN